MVTLSNCLTRPEHFSKSLDSPVTPLAATGSCPSLNSAETFQFIMLSAPSGATDTAFGSVNISTQGATVNFADIQQFTFPQGGGAPGTPKAPFATTATGACGFGAYGYTISSPATTVVTNPGGQETQSPYAVLGIGPTGLLIESALTANGLPASNLLGGGTGAVGVPQPSSALGANPVSGQGQAPQYLGFIAGAGELVSLGFATQPSSCTSVAPSTATLIYGGDFQNGDPTTSPDGYSQCNFALDLGQESSTSHGLYPSATVLDRLRLPRRAQHIVGPGCGRRRAVAGQVRHFGHYTNRCVLLHADKLTRQREHDGHSGS